MDESRFCLFVGGVGTGKTFFLLLKIWLYCETYPKSLALVIRKEFTDLRDSTMNDFERYFGVMINSHREYELPNGSKIMFRHGDDMNVLKNITLDIAGIEQGEEFETEEVFEFLRERMRGTKGKYQQINIIANANGHNWLWRNWINNPPDNRYTCVQATTFDNEVNLPVAFIEDMKSRAVTSPNYYRRMCLNSHEEVGSDDLLLSWDSIQSATDIILYETGHAKYRAMGIDVARYGNDETVFCIIENTGLKWSVIDIQTAKHDKSVWDSNSTMQTAGRAIDLRRKYGISAIGVDDDGVGGGVYDRLRELNMPVYRYQNGVKAKNEDMFANKRTEDMFALKYMIEQGDLKLMANDKLKDELMTIKFKFRSNGQKILVSKEDMRKEGIKSPNIVDALMIAISIRSKAVGAPANKGINLIHQMAAARRGIRGI